MNPTLCILACLSILATLPALAQHRLVTQGNGRLAIVEKDGSISWEMKWGGIHDIHVLENGHIMVQRDRMSKIVEIDPEKKEVVWSYDAARSNGNEGRRVEVHAFQPLPDGRIMVAESGPGRIIEIDRAGKLHREIKLKLDRPNAHSDTRLARKLANGNYLVCHENDGWVREYDVNGNVVWDFDVPLFGKAAKGGHGLDAFGDKCFGAIRLRNGNTLIATGNGHSVLEVNPAREVVWKIEQDDLLPIRFAWVTTLDELPNGNYLVGNCHAGPGQPLLVEIEPKTKKVVWQFDRFKDFGNSVPNSQVLGIETNR